jgi:hypothetical protein
MLHVSGVHQLVLNVLVRQRQLIQRCFSLLSPCWVSHWTRALVSLLSSHVSQSVEDLGWCGLNLGCTYLAIFLIIMASPLLARDVNRAESLSLWLPDGNYCVAVAAPPHPVLISTDTKFHWDQVFKQSTKPKLKLRRVECVVPRACWCQGQIQDLRKEEAE